MTLGRGSSLLKGAVISGIYFATAVFGLQIDAVSGFATLVWLPTGISLVALFTLGFQYWPAIAIGAFLANFYTGAPFPVALGISIGNTLEACVGAYFLKRIVGFRPALDRLQDVIGLVAFAALVSTLFSATVGVLSLLAGGVIPFASFFSTWLAWWIGDVISNLIVAPLLFVWSVKPRTRFDPKRVVELAVLLSILCAASAIVFMGEFKGSGVQASITYLVFPPLMWAALRFSPRIAITMTALLSVFAIGTTANGYGPFFSSRVSESLEYLQSFMSITSVTIMLFAAIVSERAQLERRKDEFISMASHELRTPLTSLKAFAQTMQRRFEKNGDKQSSLYLARMNGQIDKLSRLVLELLDIGKIQEGKIIIRKEQFNVGVLILEVINDISATTEHTITTKKLLTTRVVADRDRVGQVIINLISNAIKYSPNKKKIVIHTAKKRNFITISVQDFGMGIPKEEVRKVFEPFFRVKGKREQNIGGLGLGLFISSEIIKQHGGRIWVKSREGKGSTVSFSLPTS